ncbi:YqeG family HAD IIIA-type phosphatase [Mesoaciditoga lauensis]|uniref:YqeG family HAD IIIA-type phosphatase n=1 Tax=Mesoaciditoga lauensis TaxID=1495039 RepID=UPI0006909BBC|nr:YqeG family HAD IIIA-type phosphatase [Mesoaciditoga lauensis]
MSRILEFFRKPIPREVLKSVHDIPYDKFKVLGFDTFIFDYDNTLAPFGKKVSEDIIDMFRKLINKGFKVAVVTNGPFKRVKNLEEKVEGLRVFARARKPGLKTLKMALRKMNSKPNHTVLVGDLFFTDVIAGNRLGMYTILVAPYPGVGFFLKSVALMERISYKIIFYTFGWPFRISELVAPNEWKKNIFEIDYDNLISHGVKMFVFDMDNTLAKWRASNLDDKALKLIQELSKKAKVAILSNGSSPSLNWAARNADITVVRSAHKPLTRKLVKLMRKYGLSKSEVVMIGDQLFTDVLVANLAGIYSIKVQPISNEEIWFTKILRFFERTVKPLIKPKPKIKRRAKAEIRGDKK